MTAVGILCCHSSYPTNVTICSTNKFSQSAHMPTSRSKDRCHQRDLERRASYTSVTRKYTGGTRFSDGCLPVVRRVEDNQIASIVFPVVARILSTTCRRRAGTGRRGGPRSTQAIYTGNQLYTTVNERR